MKTCRRHFPEEPIVINEDLCTCQGLCLLKKFNKKHVEKKCKAGDLFGPSTKTQEFLTGSTYHGKWQEGYSMHGHGVYNFINGTVYEGEFKDGLMHGEGELRYLTRNGKAVIRGQWKNGIMTERTIIFDDTLKYDEHGWSYCRMPNRRFSKEFTEDLQVVNKSFLTPNPPTREVPEGFSDYEDSFYDHKRKMIYHDDDIAVAVRWPSAPERKWILENCRVSENNLYIGPRQDLYEQFVEPTLRLEPVEPPSWWNGGPVVHGAVSTDTTISMMKEEVNELKSKDDHKLHARIEMSPPTKFQ